MQYFSYKKPNIVLLQWLIWILVILIVFFTLLPQDGFYQAVANTIINTAFYAAIIYGNIKILFPFLYQRGHRWKYIISSFCFVVGIAMARGFISIAVYNAYFAKYAEEITAGTIITFIVGAFLNFMLSFIFRIALAYFEVKKINEQILLQKSEAELNLLKSQVQPHFLFNTLNNIYCEVYAVAPEPAELIEKLSDIMRYFVDESPKKRVPIDTEVQFLKNYILLEQLRIRHEVKVTFTQQCRQELEIPPMLLMTFVENIFKHGIDKIRHDNPISISLTSDHNFLVFITINRMPCWRPGQEGHGFGLKNLRKRLSLLYGDCFELNVEQVGQYFTSYLKVPIE